jgi:hypothetical protein
VTKIGRSYSSDYSVSSAVSKQSTEDNHDSLQQLSDLVKPFETAASHPSPIIDELCVIRAHFKAPSVPLYIFSFEEAEVHELRSRMSHYLRRKEFGKAESTLLNALNQPNKLKLRLQCLLLADLADVQAARSRQDESITNRGEADVLFEGKYDRANLNRLQCTESLAKNLVLTKEYEQTEALYRKVSNGYDEIYYTEK